MEEYSKILHNIPIVQKTKPELGGEKESYKITVDISKRGAMNANNTAAVALDDTRNRSLSQLYTQLCRNNVQEERKQAISSLQVQAAA